MIDYQTFLSKLFLKQLKCFINLLDIKQNYKPLFSNQHEYHYYIQLLHQYLKQFLNK